jgi:nucleotide-binding universal stress UspA family protein
MLQTILLCYDGSREGRNALKLGAEVALAMRAETHLLAILRETALVPPEGRSETHERSECDAEQAILQEGVAWLRERGLQARGHLVRGDAAREIPACARALHADLIVVGHRRRGPLERWWSDAECASLLDAAPCSILAACEPDG